MIGIPRRRMLSNPPTTPLAGLPSPIAGEGSRQELRRPNPYAAAVGGFWDGVRVTGQGPYTYSALVKANRAMSGLKNTRATKAIALDVETGMILMPPRVRQPAALANPTYRISWLEDEDLKKRMGKGR